MLSVGVCDCMFMVWMLHDICLCIYASVSQRRLLCRSRPGMGGPDELSDGCVRWCGVLAQRKQARCHVDVPHTVPSLGRGLGWV